MRMQPQPNLTAETIATTSSPAVKTECADAPAETSIVELSFEERRERAELLGHLHRKRSFRKGGESLFDTKRFTPMQYAELFELLRDPDPRLWRERILAAGTLSCSPVRGEQKRAAVQTLEA